jgi:hypothetical protein
MTPDEIEREIQADREKALENFPLKLIATTGEEAFAKWQELKSAGQGSPVVLGCDDDESYGFGNLLLPFGPRPSHIPPPEPVEETLRLAAGIRFPDDLAESENSDEPYDPPLGEWPDEPPSFEGVSVAYDILTGEPFRKVFIGLAPTDDWTTIPAYLRWGGWNACPGAEHHVAALRMWRDRYGAELVGMSSDTINLRVAKRPKTQEEALSLARDQYIYCPDLIDQGVQSYRALAAGLMANDWWYFWWD